MMSLKPFPATQYAELDLNRLTVFTIDLLNELSVPTTLENIAVANFRMFPKRFAMVGFPDYPDIARVNRALLQLRPKYRNWAVGKTKLGWQLTPAGREESRALRRKLGKSPGDVKIAPADVEPEASGKNKRTIYPEETVARLRESNLFSKYRDHWRGVEPLEVFDVLEAYTHTPAAALRHKLRLLRSTASAAGSADIVEFLNALEQRFAMIFNK